MQLRIRWNGDHCFGSELSPQFYLHGLNFVGKPKVQIKIDGRIRSNHWKEYPHLTEISSTGPVRHWEFSEALSLNSSAEWPTSATYLMEIAVTVEEPIGDQLVPLRFTETIPLKIESNHKDKKLVIHADGNSLIHIRGLDENQFDQMEIVAQENALVNLERGLADPSAAKNVEESGDLFIVLKQEHSELCFLCGDDIQPEKKTSLTLDVTMGNGVKRRWKIFFEEAVTLGRKGWSKNHPNEVSDIEYLFYEHGAPKEDWGRFLSKVISRKHLQFYMSKESFTVQDMNSKLGVDVKYQREGKEGASDRIGTKNGCSEFKCQWSDLSGKELSKDELRVSFPKVSVLLLSSYAPTQDQDLFTKMEETVKTLGVSNDTKRQRLWQVSNANQVGAVRIRRKPDLSVLSSYDDLLNYIRRGSDGEALVQQMEALCKKKGAFEKDPLALKEEYILLLHSVMIGSDAGTCAICCKNSSLDESHLTIFSMNSSFYLTNNSQKIFNLVYAGGREERCQKGGAFVELTSGACFDVGTAHFEVK